MQPVPRSAMHADYSADQASITGMMRVPSHLLPGRSLVENYLRVPRMSSGAPLQVIRHIDWHLLEGTYLSGRFSSTAPNLSQPPSHPAQPMSETTANLPRTSTFFTNTFDACRNQLNVDVDGSMITVACPSFSRAASEIAELIAADRAPGAVEGRINPPVVALAAEANCESLLRERADSPRRFYSTLQSVTRSGRTGFGTLEVNAPVIEVLCLTADSRGLPGYRPTSGTHLTTASQQVLTVRNGIHDHIRIVVNTYDRDFPDLQPVLTQGFTRLATARADPDFETMWYPGVLNPTARIEIWKRDA